MGQAARTLCIELKETAPPHPMFSSHSGTDCGGQGGSKAGPRKRGGSGGGYI